LDQKPNARKRAQRKHEKGHETEHNSTTKKEKEKTPTNKQTKLDDGQPSRASEQQTEERPQKQLPHWKKKHTHAHNQARKLS
jgi:hypothetical protein